MKRRKLAVAVKSSLHRRHGPSWYGGGTFSGKDATKVDRSAYGHFGRNDIALRWEATNRVARLA